MSIHSALRQLLHLIVLILGVRLTQVLSKALEGLSVWFVKHEDLLTVLIITKGGPSVLCLA